jgi:uncharacterized protein (DUF1778 family)
MANCHTKTFGRWTRIMASVSQNDARINVRLPRELKRTIEESASALGQTVSEFVISTVVREARQVLQDAQVTRLSRRDRDRFLAALDAVDVKPNAALKAAARRYGKLRG